MNRPAPHATSPSQSVLLDVVILVALLAVAVLFFLNHHWIVGSIVVLQTAASGYLIYKDHTRPPHEPERNPFQYDSNVYSEVVRRAVKKHLADRQNKGLPDEPAP